MSTYAAIFTMGTVTLFLVVVGSGVGLLLVKGYNLIFGERYDGL